MNVPDGYHEGPSLIYVPVCKHPKDFMFTFGPIGYQRVDKVGECPICVEGLNRRKAVNIDLD